jgi:hypothetical protein
LLYLRHLLLWVEEEVGNTLVYLRDLWKEEEMRNPFVYLRHL